MKISYKDVKVDDDIVKMGIKARIDDILAGNRRSNLNPYPIKNFLHPTFLICLVQHT